MAMRNFMRLTYLVRGKGVRLKYVGTHNQSTWSRCADGSFVEQWNAQRRNYGNGDKDERNCKFFTGISLGLFGIFSFGEDKEKEPEHELTMTIKRSIFLIQKGEYKKAEQMLHVALRQAQSLQHAEGITYVYDVMANLAYEVGENQKAKDLFTSVMQRLIASGTPQNDKKIIHISLKMSKVLERLGDMQTAEDGYKFCLQHASTHVANDPDDEDAAILYAMTFDWYARLLMSLGRFKEALENYLRSYELCLKIYGKEHEQTTILLNDLGTVCSSLGENDRALGYLTEAVEIGKRLTEQEHLSAIYINLGQVYMKKMLSDEATKACTQGLKIAKDHDDEECKERANECLVEVKKMLAK